MEAAKARFYATAGHPTAPPATPHQRHQRRVARRAGRFVHYPARKGPKATSPAASTTGP